MLSATSPLKAKMRLDLFVAEQGLAGSRSEAKSLILAGAVSVNGSVTKKPSMDVSEGDEIFVDRSFKKYVSRGGLKLEAALDAFGIDPRGRLAIDIGASSGGFTDCLLQRGAAHVVAVDSGCGQMVESLRADSRVTVIENFNARNMRPEDIEYTPSLAVMDVSFISARLIIPAVHGVLSEGGEFICLIKPQFEVGKQGVGKGGIVRDARLRESAVREVCEFAQRIGFELLGTIVSPIEGGDGNIEFLARFRKVGVGFEKDNNRS